MKKQRSIRVLQYFLLALFFTISAAQISFSQQQRHKLSKRKIGNVKKSRRTAPPETYSGPVARVDFRWYSFASDDEKFSVELPLKELGYKKDNSVQTTGTGKKIELSQFAQIHDGQTYLATYYKKNFAGYDKKNANLESYRAALHYVSGDEKIVSEQYSTFKQNGVEIIVNEIVAENKDGDTKHFRYLTDGENGYLLVTWYPTAIGNKDDFVSNAERFFKSFSIKT